MKAYTRRRDLWKKYRITPEEYDRLLAEQNGVCAGCGTSPTPDKVLHVDHIEATLIVRGLLCFRCNPSIGLLLHNSATLRALAAYLDERGAA